MTDGPERTWWRGHKLNYEADEPLLVSLLRYRRDGDREPCTRAEANLVCSRTEDGRQMAILDLDFPHRYVPSTKPGHGHLYLDVPTTFPRWALLMVALRLAGVVELGFAAWSLRRGANFVRPPGVVKTEDEFIRAEAPPRHGWVRRIR